MPNEAEFVRVIRENEGIIFKITSIYSNDADDQKDLYQEIVFQLWKSFDSFRQESKFSTWMYRIALNTSLTHLKREKRSGKKVPIDKAMLNMMDVSDSFLEERVAALYDQIRKLDSVDKALVLLHLEGKDYEEIAGITGFSATNVGTRLSRVKQKLKSHMRE